MSESNAVPVPQPESDQGDASTLFPKRPLLKRWVSLTDGKRYLFAALRPRECGDITKMCQSEHPDPKNPKETVTVTDNFRLRALMIAKSLRNPDGKRMFVSKELPDTAYLAAAERIQDEWWQPDIVTAFTAVSELSGLTEKSREDVAKNSDAT